MNSNVMLQVMRFLLLALILPAIFSFFVYYGFASNYTMRKVYSESGFRGQYENGIFRYRILGRAAVMATYDLINRYHLPAMGPKALRLLDPEASEALYTAYFIVNTVFMCLTCTVFFFVADRCCGRNEQWMVDLSLLLMMSLMALTQYVVVPYDLMSYCFLSVSILTILRERQNVATLALLISALVLCTMTRETALLIPAFYLAVNRRYITQRLSGWRLNWEQKVFALLILCLLLAAVCLRAYYGTNHAVYQQITIARWFQFPPDVIGAVFFVSLLAVMLSSEPARSESLVFLLAAAPYILAIFVVASPWETRLFCPIFLCLTILKLRSVAKPIAVAH
jgi:hypothetical protein